MKYIRTGSEIYDTDDLYVCEELAEKPYATKNGAWCIYKESIVAQADTIEELCDEFVEILPNGYHRLYDLKGFGEKGFSIKGIIKYLIETKNKILGAIWTDKGLQFVARMNSEGVLELLWVKV